MRIPVRVLIIEMASAPPLSAAAAISPMSLTFGESLTISGFLQYFRTADVMPSTPAQLVPNCTPPCLTFGQEIFSSIMSTSVSDSFSAISQYSSGVFPAIFAMIRVPCSRSHGSSCSMK